MPKSTKGKVDKEKITDEVIEEEVIEEEVVEEEVVEKPKDTNASLSEYDKKIQANIAEHRRLLKFLNISKEKDDLKLFAPKRKKTAAQKISKKSTPPPLRPRTRAGLRLQEQSTHHALSSEGSDSTPSTPTTSSSRPSFKGFPSKLPIPKKSAQFVLSSEGSDSTLSTHTASPSQHAFKGSDSNLSPYSFEGFASPVYITTKTPSRQPLQGNYSAVSTPTNSPSLLSLKENDGPMPTPTISPSRQSFDGIDSAVPTPAISPPRVSFNGLENVVSTPPPRQFLDGIDSTWSTPPTSPSNCSFEGFDDSSSAAKTSASRQYPYWTYPPGILDPRTFMYQGTEQVKKGWSHPEYPPENPEYSDCPKDAYVRAQPKIFIKKLDKDRDPAFWKKHWKSEESSCMNCDDSYHKIRKVIDDEKLSRERKDRKRRE